MKNTIAMILIFFFIAAPAFGATPSPTAEPSVSPTEESRANSLSDQINDLKNKIASRVAELDLVDKRGMVGVVKEVKSTQITIVDPQEKTRIIDIDGITKFTSPDAKGTFGISDVSSGANVSVIGLYNKQSRRILARFIEVSSLPRFLSGVITEVNKGDFTFTVLDENNVQTIVDVENITKINSYTKADGTERSGFSKLTEGVSVIVTGYPNKTEKNRVTGVRVLLLPEAPKNPGISYTPEETAAPTVPLRRVSPTATP